MRLLLSDLRLLIKSLRSRRQTSDVRSLRCQTNVPVLQAWDVRRQIAALSDLGVASLLIFKLCKKIELYLLISVNKKVVTFSYAQNLCSKLTPCFVDKSWFLFQEKVVSFSAFLTKLKLKTCLLFWFFSTLPKNVKWKKQNQNVTKLTW